jgi:hypothetical protein
LEKTNRLNKKTIKQTENRISIRDTEEGADLANLTGNKYGKLKC